MNPEVLRRIQRAKEDKSTRLDLNHMGIEEIPIELFELVWLEELDLSYNFLMSIPNEIQNLQKLKKIDFEDNLISTLLIGFFELQSLEEIDFTNNKIETIPTEIKKLQNLKKLILWGNQITILTLELFQLKNLEVLDVTYNQISIIPNEIKNLQKLKLIDFQENKISELPEELFELSELEELGLNGNNLDKIPKSITRLKNLKNIHFSRNNIKELPNDILTLDIEHLCIHENKIKNIPEVFFKRIADLQATGNLLEFPPQYLVDDYSFVKKNRLTWDALKFEYIFVPEKIGEQKKYGQATIDRRNLRETIVNLHDNLLHYFSSQQEITFNKKQRESTLQVYVDKSEENQFKILEKVRKRVEYLAKEQNLTIDERYFYHPTDSEKIDYDYLLKLKEANEKTYIGAKSGKKYDVDELLALIEPTVFDEREIEYNQELQVDFERNIENKPFLTKVQIQNFKIFENIAVDFTKDINIILGKNGLGKTSFLQALTLGLLPTDNYDKSNELEDFLRFGKKKADVYTHWGAYERRLWFYHNEMHEELPRFNPQPILIAFGSNIFVNKNNPLSNDKLIENLISGEGLPYQTKSIFEPYDTNFLDPLLVLDKLYLKRHQSEENAAKELEEIEQAIIEKLNYFLSLTKEKEQIQIHLKGTSYYFKGFGQEELQLKHLSEGYRNNVLIIANILFRIMAARKSIQTVLKNEEIAIKDIFEKARGVILIDEFDRHLHPTWQRKLIGALREVFKNIQFVLTTHNPVALMGRKPEEIHELSVNEEGKIEVLPHIKMGTEKIDVGTVLLIYFGLESILSVEMQKKVEEYHKLREQGIENERFWELEEEIDDSWIGETIYDQKYWTFLKFLKEKNIDSYEDMLNAKLDKLTQEEIDDLEAKLREIE